MMVEKASGNKGSYSNRKSRGKIPKRVHKAEREKLKREELNDLFLKLANALVHRCMPSIEMTEQSSGKASILVETIRLLKDLLGQIECLKKEHASLLSESHYVTMEKDELTEEKSVLETEVEKLKEEVESKVSKCKPDLNVPPLQFKQPEIMPKFAGDGFSLPAAEPTLQQGAAVFVVPVHNELQGFQVASGAEVASRPSKPHARYPTPADSWSSQLLGKPAGFKLN